MGLIERVSKLVHGYRIGRFRPERPVPDLTEEERAIVDRFHDLYYRRWQQGHPTIDIGWLGYRTLKCPLDLWVYQELIVERRPDAIIECGTRFGGSALFLATVCQLYGHGRVISIDIEALPDRPRHRLITYLTGSSTDPATVAEVARLVGEGGRNLVILDSDHSADHVRAELDLYRRFVGVGDYLVVEDTNINGHPTFPEFGPGPMEAVDAFLAANPDFAIDATRERFLMTLNPRGYLRRIDRRP